MGWDGMGSVLKVSLYRVICELYISGQIRPRSPRMM